MMNDELQQSLIKMVLKSNEKNEICSMQPQEVEEELEIQMSLQQMPVNKPHRSKLIICNSDEISKISQVMLNEDQDNIALINSLDLSFKNLHMLHISKVNYINTLQEINLACNDFQEIPFQLYALKSLRKVRLDFNQISAIQEDIESLTQLEYLSLTNNKLECMPSNIQKLTKLHTLMLSRNKLNHVDLSILRIPNLHVLHLQNNFIQGLPSFLGNNSTIFEYGFEWLRFCEPPLPESINNNNVNHQKKFQKMLTMCRSKLEKEIQPSLEIPIFSFIEALSDSAVQLGNKRYFNRQNVLHNLVLEDDLSMLAIFNQKYPDLINQLDSDQQTPFTLAILNAKIACANILLESAFLNVNVGGGYYGSALHLAVQKLDVGLVERILLYGGDVNARDHDKNTPLHTVFISWKQSSKAGDIAQLLLVKGADTTAFNCLNWTPIHFSIKSGQFDSLKWIIQYNKLNVSSMAQMKVFDLNQEGGPNQLTPLHLATHYGQSEMVQFLMENGCCIFTENARCDLPRTLATHSHFLLKFIKKLERQWIHMNILFPDNLQKFAQNLNHSNVAGMKSRIERSVNSNCKEQDNISGQQIAQGQLIASQIRQLQSQFGIKQKNSPQNNSAILTFQQSRQQDEESLWDPDCEFIHEIDQKDNANANNSQQKQIKINNLLIVSPAKNKTNKENIISKQNGIQEDVGSDVEEFNEQGIFSIAQEVYKNSKAQTNNIRSIDQISQKNLTLMSAKEQLEAKRNQQEYIIQQQNLQKMSQKQPLSNQKTFQQDLQQIQKFVCNNFENNDNSTIEIQIPLTDKIKQLYSLKQNATIQHHLINETIISIIKNCIQNLIKLEQAKINLHQSINMKSKNVEQTLTIQNQIHEIGMQRKDNNESLKVRVHHSMIILILYAIKLITLDKIQNNENGKISDVFQTLMENHLPINRLILFELIQFKLLFNKAEAIKIDHKYTFSQFNIQQLQSFNIQTKNFSRQLQKQSCSNVKINKICVSPENWQKIEEGVLPNRDDAINQGNKQVSSQQQNQTFTLEAQQAIINSNFIQNSTKKLSFNMNANK